MEALREPEGAALGLWRLCRQGQQRLVHGFRRRECRLHRCQDQGAHALSDADQRSRPRRGRFDDQGRLWFAEFGGERIGMFDTKTKLFKEWEAADQRVRALRRGARQERRHLDRRHERRQRSCASTPRRRRLIEYPLPRSTNVRRVFVDNATTPPTFWVGNNHGAAIIKLEPLD